MTCKKIYNYLADIHLPWDLCELKLTSKPTWNWKLENKKNLETYSLHTGLPTLKHKKWGQMGGQFLKIGTHGKIAPESPPPFFVAVKIGRDPIKKG